MKNLTLKAKKEILTSSGSVKKLYKNALEHSRFDGLKVYPKSYRGSGRYISLRDNSYYVETALKLNGYKYTSGNDAVKGGKVGDFIKTSKSGISFLKELKN